MANEHYLKQELYTKIRNEPALFDWIENGSLDGVWYWDLQKPEHEWLSPRFSSLFGYEQGEIPHTSQWWQENIHPDDLPGVLENFEKHKQDENHPYDQIVRYFHKNGSLVWVRCRGLIIRDDNGVPIRMIGAHTDVTELMETKSALYAITEQPREAKQLTDLALRACSVGIWIWSIKDRALRWMDQMFLLHGLDGEGFDGSLEYWLRQVHPDDVERVRSQFDQFDQIGSDVNKLDISFRIVLPGGIVRYLQSLADVQFGEDGTPAKLMGASWDITKIKEKEEALQRSNQELRSFAHIASHDLRAPLRGIKQLASWVVEDLGDVPENVKKHLDTMQGRIRRMENLLKDLLEYSKIGRQNNCVEYMDCRVEFERLFEMLSAPDGYSLILDDSLPCFETYRVPLTIVASNLLSNSIKHRNSDLGSVTIRCLEFAHYYEFIFADDGPGIPLKYQEKVFDMFQTLRSRDEVEGSGMGLAAVDKVVKQLKQKVWLEDVACGTCVRFTWPKGVVAWLPPQSDDD